MSSFAIKLAFAGIGSLVAHWSEGFILIAVCAVLFACMGAITAYLPFLAPFTKRIEIGLAAVAFGVALILIGEGIGAHDMAARSDAQAAVVTTEVHTDVTKARKNPGVDKWGNEP